MNNTDIAQANAYTPKKKFVAKGHDAQLQDAQFGNHEVVVTLMSGGDTITGNIVKRDKFTITVREHEALNDCIIYKHAIETIVIRKKG